MVRLVVALFSFSLAVTTTPSRLRLSSLRRALYPVRSLLMMMVLVSVTNPRQETLIVFYRPELFDCEPSFIVGYRPLLTLHGHHSREFHRHLGSLVHHRSRDGVGLGKRYGARQEQNQYQKKSPHGLLIDVQLSFPDDIAVILHHSLLPLFRVAWLGESGRGAFVPF